MSGPDGGEAAPVDELLSRREQRRLTRLPVMLATAIRIVRAAAPRELRWMLVLQAVVSVGIVAQLLVGRAVIEQVVDSDVSVRDALPSVLAFAAATAAVAVALRTRTELQRLVAELVSRDAMDRVLDVATRAELLDLDRPGFHDRLQRALVNASGRPSQMTNGLLTVLGSAFAVGGAVVALFVIEPVFAAVLLVGFAPAWLLTAAASRASYGFSVDQVHRDRQRSYLASLLTRKEEAGELRANESAGALRERHTTLWSQRIADLRSLVRRRIVLGLLAGLVTVSLTTAVILLLVWLVSRGDMSVADAGAATGGVIVLTSRLLAVMTGSASLYESSLFLEDYTAFVDETPPAPPPTGRAEPLSFDRIRLDDVSFTYPSREQPAVRHVSIEIGAGEVVAFVGENGSGKTTLAKLLAGLYAPEAGTIVWDGTPTTQLDPARLRRSVAVVFQDFVRYFLSARDNIALGDPSRPADDDAVDAAAARAGAGFLRELAHGYDTRLGPQFWFGTDLSLGQWQRVALARAAFRDSPLLILDEPTASMDARAEAALFDDIRGIWAGRSVLLISHRFSSVRSADRIYVLHEGRVVEHGSHDELLATEGHYAEMFRLQAAAYLDHER